MSADAPRLIVVDADELPAAFDAIAALPSHRAPALAARLLSLALGHLGPNSGIVMLTRGELAEALGVRPETLSVAVSALQHLGILRGERFETPGGGRGGSISYFVNPAVAWSGDLAARSRWSGGFAPLGRRERIASRGRRRPG